MNVSHQKLVLGELLAARQLVGDEPDEAAIDQLAWALLEHNDPLLEHLRRTIAELKLEEAARRLLSASQRTSRTDDGTERLDLLGLARRAGRHWAPRSPLLGVAMAEWLGLPLPLGAAMPAAAKAAQGRALELYLDELRLEQQVTAAHNERAASPAEQVRLQRRSNALADEIARVEAMQTPPPAGLPPTTTSPGSKGARAELAASEEAPPTGQTAAPDQPSPARQPTPADGTAANTRPPSPARGRGGQGVRATWLPELINVPAGPFLMGSSNADKPADGDEKPQHTLTLPDYWIGKAPITNAQFRPFVEGDGYTNRSYLTEAGWQWREADKIVMPGYWTDAQRNGADQPVIGVSWFEAVAYCRWLSAQTDHPFRLPSEAEWEKAARGPDGRIWPWGNTWEAGRCNSEEAGLKKTSPVGQYPNSASTYGTLDMAGNVWEWCATEWGKDYPYQLEDEWLEGYVEQDANRVLRGGSWYNPQTRVRGAYRGFVNPRYRNYYRGLRVASHSPLPGSDS